MAVQGNYMAQQARLVYVEIGAGDLKASIRFANQGIRVIAIDPFPPNALAIQELEAAGGIFLRGTASTVKMPAEDREVDHVFSYFPWDVPGGVAVMGSYTFTLVADAARLLKANGTARFVCRISDTAEFLIERARELGLRTDPVRTSTAGEAAPGASGFGTSLAALDMPPFSPLTEVWEVNIRK
ncbi:MAG: hypothetical protein ABSF93_20835 [Candidatus Sulfotelmatobacter sp.]|jgi:hypothetical protein